MSKKIISKDFVNIYDKIDKLTEITNEYIFQDLVQAVYCINICINNRSVIESCIALNACLFEHSNKGKKTINNYEEFKCFFTKIQDICKPTIRDDYLVEDFGEVRVNYNNKFYRVILGTGYNNVFACLNFLPTISQILKKENDLRLVLEYSSNIIEYFLDDNKSDNVEQTRFVLPSSELFDRTRSFFKNEISSDTIRYLSNIFDVNDEIEKQHFIMENSHVYPLYNTSILVDLYDIWERDISNSERIDLVNNGIIKKLFDLFELDRSDDCSMFVPVKLFSEENQLEKQPVYTFAAKGEKGVIIAINTDEYSNDSLVKEIEKIRNLHKVGKLELGEVYDRFKSKKLRKIQIKSHFPIKFLLYNSFSNPNKMKIIFEEDGSNIIVTALDILYYLNFMENIDELFDYLAFRENFKKNLIFGFGSDASLFLTWKKNQRYISKGAKEFDIINVGYDIENEYVVEYFKNELKVYPFISGDFYFHEPFAWKIDEFEPGSFNLYSKFGVGYGGRFIPLSEENYIFRVDNTMFYESRKSIEEHSDIINLLDEIIVEGVKSLKDIFFGDKDNQNDRIILMYMPEKYARNVKFNFCPEKYREYCYSDYIYYEGKYIIRFVVKDLEKIYFNLERAHNRCVELKILEEILSPFLESKQQLYSQFKDKILSLSEAPKRVGVLSKEIYYKWNPYYKTYTPEMYHFHRVRKNIAILCKSNNISPGIYKGRSATKIIRSIQKKLIEDFESEILKFVGLNLHCKLLDYYSVLQHSIYIDRERYGSYQNLDLEKEEEVRNKIINHREKAKQEVRSILYLIETNLFLNKESNKKVKNDDFLYLISYADWLITLNDTADICFFTGDEACIEVTEDFVVNTIAFKTEEENKELLERIYNTDGLIRDSEIDKFHLKKIKESFEEDTDLNFDLFLTFLSYLSKEFDENKMSKIGDNIYSSSREVILNDFIDKFNSPKEVIDVHRFLDYLIIDKSKLKTLNNRNDYYLPIGDKSNRIDRFEVKPIVSYGEKIIFSPITIDSLRREWIHGLLDFMLPYKNKLEKTFKAVLDWKKEYENKIVYDLKKIFDENKFDLVKTNFELVKINKMHPKELGDYDVFVIDKTNKNVWIIECKVILKVTTFFDMYKQQKRFFLEEKEDEKFQRRIDYMNKHVSTIVEQLGFTNSEEYKIKPYMCVNKVFVSRYKEISFPIVSYSEMEGIIRASNGETNDIK